MTEEQAKEQWCPFVRRENASPTLHGLKKLGDTKQVQYSTNCIGSKCMAWRKTQAMQLSQDPDFPDDQSEAGILVTQQGFCGLAGKP